MKSFWENDDVNILALLLIYIYIYTNTPMWYVQIPIQVQQYVQCSRSKIWSNTQKQKRKTWFVIDDYYVKAIHLRVPLLGFYKMGNKCQC